MKDSKSIVLSRRARFIATALAATGIAVYDEQRAARAEVPVAPDASTAPPTEEAKGLAREHFERARLLFVEGNYDASCFELEKSIALASETGAVRLLAQCYEKKNDWARAHARYLEVGDREQEEAARAHCAEIELATTPPGAEIRVDDDVTTPRNGRILVNPGHHKITVTSLGYPPETHVVTVAAGEHAIVGFHASPVPCLEPPRHDCRCDVPGLRRR